MRSLVAFGVSAVGFLLSFAAVENAWAGPVRETVIASASITPERVSTWNSLPGKRSYRIVLDDPGSSDLQPLLGLQNYERLQIEAKFFPQIPEAGLWKKLAERGAEFVSLESGLPNDPEIDRMNDAGFKGCVIVSTSFPSGYPAQALGRLKCDLSLTFAVTKYPLYVDKPGLLDIPSNIPLLFSTDYWPYYVHMDVMNLIPHKIRIRVRDMYPPDDEIDYLRHIQRLERVTVDTTYAPPVATWKAFGDVAVTWSARDFVPSAAELADFASSGRSRSLIIDSDIPLTDEERSRLSASPLDVEWIHESSEQFLYR